MRHTPSAEMSGTILLGIIAANRMEPIERLSQMVESGKLENTKPNLRGTSKLSSFLEKWFAGRAIADGGMLWCDSNIG